MVLRASIFRSVVDLIRKIPGTRIIPQAINIKAKGRGSALVTAIDLEINPGKKPAMSPPANPRRGLSDDCTANA